eukprot:3733954-Amphidinium_carterae.1
MVDDINVQFIQDAERIGEVFEHESERFFAEMQQVQLPINYAKTVVLVAPTSAERLVQPYLTRMGIKAARVCKTFQVPRITDHCWQTTPHSGATNQA